MKKNQKDVYNEDKQFEYVPPKKEDPKYLELLESHEKLKENYGRLDTNMRTMYNDNKTLRKHVIDQQRSMKTLSNEINSVRAETRRLQMILEAMLKEDEQRFK